MRQGGVIAPFLHIQYPKDTFQVLWSAVGRRLATCYVSLATVARLVNFVD